MVSAIDYEIKGDHIAILTLNRPEAMHAMSASLLDELNDYVQMINADDAIRCTIITASGDKAFCAGADLKERHMMTEEQVIQSVQSIGRTATNIENMTMPVIAAINGAAFGGGLELALACDIRIAAEHAKMGLTETSLAIIPGSGGTQRLPRLIGPGQAKRLIFSAQSVTAEEAYHIGIAEQVAPSDKLLQEAVEMAQSIISNGPVALHQAKTAINQGLQTDMTTGLSIEHLCYRETISTEDRNEGLNAFQEKRQPVYKGK